MKVERDYLFYGLPPVQATHEPRESSSEFVKTENSSNHGLCWLTYQSDEEDRRPSDEPMGPAIPKFFSAPPSHQILNVVRENVVPFLQHNPISESETWFIIWNDQAGRGSSKRWLDQIILPILNFAGFSTHQIQIHQSWQEGHPPEGLFETLFKSRSKLIILGGDGTVSDLLNQLFRFYRPTNLRENSKLIEKIRFDLVIIPLGTANAMFFNLHPELKHLTRPREILTGLMNALLEATRRADGLAEPLPPILPLAWVQTIDRSGNRGEALVSFVVASTALHASILHTANELVRQPEHKSSGVQVFKEAFEINVSKTWNASVKLLPASLDSNESVELYDHKTNQLSKVGGAHEAHDRHLEIELDGPFSYFTSCLVDRLESDFIIAPLRRAIDRSDGEYQKRLSSTIDLVIVRPMRDSRLVQLSKNQPDSTGFQEAMSQLLWKVMEGAYQEGHHINLLETDHDGHQSPIVEYYRCGGWNWKPVEQESEHEVCIDGRIIQIPAGGSVECKVMAPHESEIRVY